MSRYAVHRGIGSLLVALAIVATACDSRPTPDVFDPTTTSLEPSAGETVTTTMPTLPPAEEQIVASVVSVTDGDTVTLRISGVESDVRLLGINAPETSECWGLDATSALSTMITGKEVVLVSGEEDVDTFGRLLRYIYLDAPEGTVFVNSDMVNSGNAVGLQNGHEFEREFKLLEAQAFQSGKGMWGTVVCGDEEAIRADRPVVRVGDIQYDPEGPDSDRLDEEWVTIVNEGYGRVSLAGWVLRDESSRNRMTFPADTVLAPGDEVTIVTGCDGGPPDSIHWCNDGAVWSNDGDTVIVSDTLGNAVIWYTYAGG